MEIWGLFWIRISLSRRQFKDLRCKSLHFVHMRERTDQKKAFTCKFVDFTQSIYPDINVLLLLTLVIL